MHACAKLISLTLANPCRDDVELQGTKFHVAKRNGVSALRTHQSCVYYASQRSRVDRRMESDSKPPSWPKQSGGELNSLPSVSK
jgi:hypothetical protein